MITVRKGMLGGYRKKQMIENRRRQLPGTEVKASLRKYHQASRTEHLGTSQRLFSLRWDDWNSHLGIGMRRGGRRGEGASLDVSNETGGGEGGQVGGHLWIGKRSRLLGKK